MQTPSNRHRAGAVDSADAGAKGSGSSDVTRDPFLMDYDVERFKLDLDTAEQLLGVAVVVSNVVNN